MARKRLCPDGWTVTPFRARNSATSRNNNHMFKVENYPNSGSNLERFSTSGDTARHPVLAAIRHNSGDQREGLGALQNVPSSALCALCRAVRDAVQRLPIGLLSHRKPNLEHLTRRLNRLWVHMTARIGFNIPTGTKGPVMNGEALF